MAASNSDANGIALVAQLLDAAAAGGSGGGKGQFRRTGCEPFDLLQLDTVPGGVADDGVEAADGIVVLPVAPDAGEGDLPVEEVFAVGDLWRAEFHNSMNAGQKVRWRMGSAAVDASGPWAKSSKARSVPRAMTPTSGCSKTVRAFFLRPALSQCTPQNVSSRPRNRGGRFLDFAKELG